MWGKSVVILVALNLAAVLGSDEDLNNRTFPDGFMFGVATSAYQVEGGWDADGKGMSVWDYITHIGNPYIVMNQENGDVACDTYHKWKEDVVLLKDMGVNHYRFSLSWTRILPTGFANKVNEAGVTYYKNLIKELKANGIEPVVTLHHWDFPQSLQEIGGWPNTKLADYFADYARVAFREFGDDVKYWTTFNEPQQTCEIGYGTGGLAPDIHSPGVADYLCVYTVLLAHAKAYHIYDEEFRPTQNGSVGIVIDTYWAEPLTDSEADIAAADRRLQFGFGIYAHPIFNGNWPQVVIDRVKLRSEGENFTRSRLPEFTEEQIAFIKGTHDYFGVNSYSTTLVQDIDEPAFGEPSCSLDQKLKMTSDPSWNASQTGWLMIVPWGERKLLKWIKDNYNDPKILITESGVPDDGTSLEDDERIYYLRSYLSAVLDAIYEDEVNVIGYTAWSFMDNFEWGYGYSVQHFGFYSVNFSDPDLPRTPKKSLDVYKNIISTHCLLDKCENGSNRLAPSFAIILAVIVCVKSIFSYW